MIAYCGLDCVSCPIYLATKELNRAKRIEMRKDIFEQYGKDWGIKDIKDIIDCDGCLGEGGRQGAGCKKCNIRKCAQSKGLENCAHCSGYACDKLEEFFNHGGGQAKKRLDAIRNSL